MASEAEEVIRVGRRTELFRGPVITLVEREVDGKTFRVVEHPGASCAVPVTPDGKIVLIRQFRPAIGEWIWEIPAGTLEPDESPEECIGPRGHRGDRLGGGESQIAGEYFHQSRVQQPANTPVRRLPVAARGHETREHRKDQRSRSRMGRGSGNDGASGNTGCEVARGVAPIRKPVWPGSKCVSAK